MTSRFERLARARGYPLVAGADEAGRGCLFGPVIAAAVILDPGRPVRGLADSKALTTARRELLAARIRERAQATAVAGVDPFGIDRWNIHQATRLALRQAVERLSPQPDFVYVDGPLTLDIALPQQPLIKGDARCASVAAASILAKVTRDAAMARWAEVYPEFGLAVHKGYASPQHLAALRQASPSPHHRFSFAPVREALGLGQSALFAE